MKTVQLLAIALLVILFANILLFAMGKVTPLFFWIVIGICALGALLIRKTGKR